MCSGDRRRAEFCGSEGTGLGRKEIFSADPPLKRKGHADCQGNPVALKKCFVPVDRTGFRPTARLRRNGPGT